MDFNLQIDPGALINLPDVKSSTTSVRVTSSELAVQFGEEFEAHIDRSAVSSAQEIPDPRPGVYFPMGLSAAVERLGRETLCIVTSYDGLVRIDFNRDVEGKTSPPNYMGKQRAVTEGTPVQFRSLILSMQKPGDFVQALGQRVL